MMDGIALLASALVGGIVGWVAVTRSGPEFRRSVIYIVAGMFGAVLGAWLLGMVGVATTGPGGLLLRSVVGAILPILLIHYWTKRTA